MKTHCIKCVSKDMDEMWIDAHFQGLDKQKGKKKDLQNKKKRTAISKVLKIRTWKILRYWPGSDDCGVHLSTVNCTLFSWTLPCSRNQLKTFWALWHGASSSWEHCGHEGMHMVRSNTLSVICHWNNAQVLLNVSRRYSPHHYTSSSLSC